MKPAIVGEMCCGDAERACGEKGGVPALLLHEEMGTVITEALKDS